MELRIYLAALGICTAGLLAGCEHDGGEDPEIAMPQPDRCTSEAPGIPIFWWDLKSVQPGQVLELNPTILHGPYSEKGDTACLANFTVTPAGPEVARGKDGVWRLTIPADVADGKAFRLRADYGAGEISGNFVAYRPESQPLVGTWRQDGKQCRNGGEPLRELVFMADGSFKATWTPFETYVDYWGLYAYDKDTGELSFEITGGNAKPGDARSGTITLDGDRFKLGTASFGSRPQGTCDAPFSR